VSKVYQQLDISIPNNFMKFFDKKKKSNLITITIFVACITVSGLLFVPFLQVQQLIITRIQGINDDSDSSYSRVAFAYHGKEISEKLSYAHFLPLGSGNNQSRQLNQVKVIVNYTVMEPSIINKNMNTLMHVYTPNGTLIKRSSFADGFIVNATTSKSQLATTITDSRVKDVRAFVFFTNAERNQNFSSPLSVNLTLGQRIPK
jgi:hypothetical protein